MFLQTTLNDINFCKIILTYQKEVSEYSVSSPVQLSKKLSRMNLEDKNSKCDQSHLKVLGIYVLNLQTGGF